MTPVAKRLILEAAAVAPLFRSDIACRTAAREVAGIDVADLVGGSQALGHILVAIRECVVGLGLAGGFETRRLTADAIGNLVKAARGHESAQASPAQVHAAAPRLYWVGRD